MRGDGLFPGPHARLGDPDTSHQAIPMNVTAQAFQVLAAYEDGAALLDIEAYARVRLDGHQRCTDLRRAQFITRDGRRTMPSGKDGYTCRITPAGLTFLRLYRAKDLPGDDLPF